MSEDRAKLAAEVRAAADTVEWLLRRLGWADPARGEISARQLRYEADYLGRPDEPVPSA